MTEERLNEIKNSIDFQITATKAYGYDETLINEELELYNEVVRLREIIDKVNKFIDEFIQEDYYEKLDEYITHFTWNTTKNDLQDILKQSNLTLEQLTGIAND